MPTRSRRSLPVPAPEDRPRLRAELIVAADQAHVAWPQYKGHWDDWALGIMRERHWAHGATLAERGDLVLVKPGPHELRADNPEHAYITVHAARYGVDCSVRAGKVELLP